MGPVLAAAGAVLLAGLLSGCAPVGDAPAASMSPASPVDLLPTVWHVHDAEGADPATYLLFSLHDAEVLEPNGFVDTDWETQGDAMLASVTIWSNTLHRSTAPAVPWLTGATRIARSGSGYALLDGTGRTLATLTDDGPAPTRDDTITTPWPVSPDDATQFARPVAAAGSRTLPTSALVGRWVVAGQDPTPASLTFRSDGTWSSAVLDPCDSSQVPRRRGFGSYRLLAGGFLLHTDIGSSSGELCVPRTATVPPADLAAVTQFFGARSVQLDGDRLTLFDTSGARIGTLTRVG